MKAARTKEFAENIGMPHKVAAVETVNNADESVSTPPGTAAP